MNTIFICIGAVPPSSVYVSTGLAAQTSVCSFELNFSLFTFALPVPKVIILDNVFSRFGMFGIKYKVIVTRY